MAEIVYQDTDFAIVKTHDDFVLKNLNGNYKHHSHVRKLSTAKLLIELVRKMKVPDSKYLRDAALRISVDDKYIEKVRNKINKDSSKEHYINVNKKK